MATLVVANGAFVVFHQLSAYRFILGPIGMAIVFSSFPFFLPKKTFIDTDGTFEDDEIALLHGIKWLTSAGTAIVGFMCSFFTQTPDESMPVVLMIVFFFASGLWLVSRMSSSTDVANLFALFSSLALCILSLVVIVVACVLWFAGNENDTYFFIAADLLLAAAMWMMWSAENGWPFFGSVALLVWTAIGFVGITILLALTFGLLNNALGLDSPSNDHKSSLLFFTVVIVPMVLGVVYAEKWLGRKQHND